MLNVNHPDDERLATLADPHFEADADPDLAAHVSTCSRCADVVDELGMLRAALAELPDIAPPRPLRLLPTADPAPATVADRLGGWVRRYFAPVMTAGAALALVGAVGTAAPALSGGQDAAPMTTGNARLSMDGAESASQEQAAQDHEVAAPMSSDAVSGAGGGDVPADDEQRSSADDLAEQPLPAARSPWPMLLFTGLALVVAAIGLRWILAPRAG